jgi:chromosomal replication initiation ATPase DnaA
MIKAPTRHGGKQVSLYGVLAPAYVRDCKYNEKMKTNRLRDILSVCAEEFDVSMDEVVSSSRKQGLVYCRKAYCMIIKEMFDVKLEIIARPLNRSVNSVSSCINKQPANKYYNVCLRRIRDKLKTFT